MAQIDEYISKLGLRARGLEIIHPDKGDAITALRGMGVDAIEPMAQALSDADETTASCLIELLGLTKDDRAIGPIVDRLSHPHSGVRWSAVNSLGAFQMNQLEPYQVIPLIQSLVIGDDNADVRDEARAFLTRAGAAVPERPWHADAKGWLPLTEAFLRYEIAKPAPDYRGFADRLAAVSGEEKHGAWTRVAGSVRNKMAATRCYLEALYHAPGPDSIAWGWLSGEYDRSDSVLHVIGSADPRTRETVERLRYRIGSITEEEGSSPFEFETSGETFEQAHASAAARLGEALPLAEVLALNTDVRPVTVTGEGESPEAALDALERSLPSDATVMERYVLAQARQRVVQLEAFDRLQARRQAEQLAALGETVGEPRLITEGKSGFLGIGKQPGRYEATLESNAQVSLTYSRKVVLRFVLYRRGCLDA